MMYIWGLSSNFVHIVFDGARECLLPYLVFPAVIENEYGEISIDRSLVKQQLGTSEEIFEVSFNNLRTQLRS